MGIRRNIVILIFALLVIFSCTTTYIKFDTKYGKLFINKVYISSDSTLYLNKEKFILLDIASFDLITKGLAKPYSIKKKQELKKLINQNLNIFFSSNFKGYIKKEQRDFIIAENLYNFYNIIIKKRSKLENNFTLTKDDIKNLKDFYNKKKIRYIIIPINFQLTQNQNNPIGDKKIIKFKESLFIQIWDTKLGDIVFESILTIRNQKEFTTDYQICQYQCVNMPNMLLNKLFYNLKIE